MNSLKYKTNNIDQSRVNWISINTSTPSFSEMSRETDLTDEEQGLIGGLFLAGWTTTMISQRVGRSRTAITNYLRDVQRSKKKRLNVERHVNVTPQIRRAILKESSFTGASTQTIKRLNQNLPASTVWAALSTCATLRYQKPQFWQELSTVYIQACIEWGVWLC